MKQFLKIEEEPSSNEVEIDPDNLKLFNSQLKRWKYAKILAAEFQKLSFDDRSSILKKYYADMCTTYLVGASKMFSVSFLAVFELVLGCFYAVFSRMRLRNFKILFRTNVFWLQKDKSRFHEQGNH